jgi:hypothetical protein
MTLTTAAEVTAVVPAAEEEDVDLATPYDIAVALIQKEAHCKRKQAVGCIEFVTRMLDKARDGSRSFEQVGVYHLTNHDMNQGGYDVMDAIMPHDVSAAPGSAHAALETLLLQPDEFGLVHSNPTGQKSDCSVKFGTRKAL